MPLLFWRSVSRVSKVRRNAFFLLLPAAETRPPREDKRRARGAILTLRVYIRENDMRYCTGTDRSRNRKNIFDGFVGETGKLRREIWVRIRCSAINDSAIVYQFSLLRRMYVCICMYVFMYHTSSTRNGYAWNWKCFFPLFYFFNCQLHVSVISSNDTWMNMN